MLFSERLRGEPWHEGLGVFGTVYLQNCHCSGSERCVWSSFSQNPALQTCGRELQTNWIGCDNVWMNGCVRCARVRCRGNSVVSKGLSVSWFKWSVLSCFRCNKNWCKRSKGTKVCVKALALWRLKWKFPCIQQ